MGNYILIAIAVGLILALIVTSVMRASLKSVSKQYSAVFYEKEEGLKLSKKNDVFMYKKVDRIAKPKEQPRPNNGPQAGGRPQPGNRPGPGPRR